MHSDLVIYAINNRVPEETIRMILMLPILVTMIAFFRQVVGIKAFGIYTPALMIFAFVFIGKEGAGFNFWNGIKYGTAIFIAVILIGTLARIVMKHFRLLYLPRVAIVITIVALSTLLLLVFGGYFGRTGLANVTIFPILIMIMLVEKFVTTQIEKGGKTAVYLSLETLIISLIGYLIATRESLNQLLLMYPWLVLFTILINIALGKWTGLRLLEYFRFKEVIKNAQPPQKK